MRDTVQAPFSASQIAALRARQQLSAFHPYTCPVHSHAALAVLPSGLRCQQPGCEYRQSWALAADA